MGTAGVFILLLAFRFDLMGVLLCVAALWAMHGAKSGGEYPSPWHWRRWIIVIGMGDAAWLAGRFVVGFGHVLIASVF